MSYQRAIRELSKLTPDNSANIMWAPRYTIGFAKWYFEKVFYEILWYPSVSNFYCCYAKQQTITLNNFFAGLVCLFIGFYGTIENTVDHVIGWKGIKKRKKIWKKSYLHLNYLNCYNYLTVPRAQAGSGKSDRDWYRSDLRG